MYFLLGNCRFGSYACVYSHDKTYLQTGGRWKDEGKRLILRHMLTSLHPEEHPAFMPFIFGLIDDRLAWASADGVEMEDVLGHWRIPAMNTFREAVDIGLAWSVLKKGGAIAGSSKGQIIQFHDEDEWDTFIEERMGNFGFTEDKETWNCFARVSSSGTECSHRRLVSLDYSGCL